MLVDISADISVCQPICRPILERYSSDILVEGCANYTWVGSKD